MSDQFTKPQGEPNLLSEKKGFIFFSALSRISFLHKVTYADVMSTVSIILSAITLVYMWRSDASNLAVSSQEIKTETRCNRAAGKWEVAGLVTIQIRNNGKAVTSLTEIRQMKRPNPIMAKPVGKPRQFPASAVLLVPRSVNQIPPDANPLDLEELFIEGAEAERTFLNFDTQTGHLSVTLPPGKGTINSGIPADLTLGFVSDLHQQGSQIRHFILTFELFFSNGEQIPVKARLETSSNQGRTCPP